MAGNPRYGDDERSIRMRIPKCNSRNILPKIRGDSFTLHNIVDRMHFD